MIAKLELTNSNVQQTIDQLETPTMGENSHNGSNNQQRINNNRTIALDRIAS